jgi:putative ABC transport system permease protein
MRWGIGWHAARSDRTAMSSFLSDVRLAVRLLVKNPSFAVVAAGTLALGIGANTAVFSLLNAVLLRPLPYAAPDRLAMAWEVNFAREGNTNVVGPANFLRWKERSSSFAGMAAIVDVQRVLTGAGEPAHLQGQGVSAELFRLLGVRAALGRTFTADEDKPGRDNVVLLSDGLWRARFGGDPATVGRAVALNGRSLTVVGILPPGFNVLLSTADFWTPIAFDETARTPQGRYLRVIGRLRDGVSIGRAQADMDAVAAGLRAELPDFDTGWGVRLVPLSEQVVGEIRPILLVLFGAVAMVLLLACVNVANLVLNKGLSREREFAVRAALGAGRARLVQQVLTEGLVLAAVGGALGIGLAAWALGWLLPAAGRVFDIPRIESVGLDRTVLAFAVAASFLTVAVFALIPALSVSRLHVEASLRQGARGGQGDRARQVLRRTLAVAQLALAFTLLIGAGLMVRSVAGLLAVDPGFRPDHLLTLRVMLPSTSYPEQANRVAFMDRATGELGRIPGVSAVGASSRLPFRGFPIGTSFSIEGRPSPGEASLPVADVAIVHGDYFRALDIPLRQGRFFDGRDGEPGRRAAIINETLARRLFAGENPLGRRLFVRLDDDIKPDEIVGVVGDVKHAALDVPVRPTIYWPNRQAGFSLMGFALRTNQQPASISGAAAAAIHRIDPGLAVSEIAAMTDVVEETVARRRFTLDVLGVFAALALGLAALGVYGVLSYGVSRRLPEFGIRLALGAAPGELVRSVLRESAVLSAVGIAVGLAAALAVGRLIQVLLYGVKASDPTTFAGVSLILAGVALIAAWIPARRAARVDPVVALRAE